VLVFSRTVEYRHASIEDGVEALQTLADQRGWALSATEDAAMFMPHLLAEFDVVVFLSTTGDVLDAAQQVAFEDFIGSGNGYVGVHAASDTEYDWPWYGDLVGAYFSAHPDIQEASVLVEDAEHPATVGLGSPWIRTDEWYGFDQNPRGAVSVLLAVDESSYDAGEGSLGDDHPIAWYHEYDGGRSFYTALGHTAESYIEPSFLTHLAGGIEWAAGTP
jgi:cytochrome c